MTKAQKIAYNEKRRNHYKQLASDRRMESLDRSFKAGEKRQWIMGVSVPSKRDIMSALRSDLININQQCVGEGLNPIFMDEEEEPVKLPKPIE
mgnify:CR=1 FL=1|tara:strand:+ start:291 stop:569 length:279 start_codon:yes stop_codon:yes gene_type:complete